LQIQCATTTLSSLTKVDDMIVVILLKCVPLINTGWIFPTSVALFEIMVCVFVHLSSSVLIVYGENRKGHSWNWVLVVGNSPLVRQQSV
jgi:hypothetical protein